MPSKLSSSVTKRLRKLTQAMPIGQDHEAAWDEVTGGTDRAAALVISAWLDLSLEQAIRAILYVDTDDALSSIFGQQAPLSTYGGKNSVAFALGIYGPKTKEALSQIGKIRNVFAHAPSVVSFSNPEIIDACSALTNIYPLYVTIAHLELNGLEVGDGSARDNFLDASLCIYLALSKWQTHRLEVKISVLKGGEQSVYETQLGTHTVRHPVMQVIMPFMP